MAPKHSSADSIHTSTGMKYTTFSSIGQLNGKHVASNYSKSDHQSWFARRPNDAEWQQRHQAKRRRLMASEEEFATTSHTADSSRVNVLKSALPGLIRPPRTHAIEQQSTDDPADQLTKTIVVHPGSRSLRIGRASDAYPVKVPNLVARKLRGKAVPPSQSCPLAAPTMTPFGVHPADPPTIPLRSHEASESEDEAANPVQQSQATDPLSMKIASVRTDFKVRMRAFNLRGQGSANEQAKSYNETVEPERLEAFNDPGEIEWTEYSPDAGKDVLVGLKALRLSDPAAAGFIARQPFDRGTFNTTGYACPQELMGDIEALWTISLEEELGISLGDLQEYSCILLIPDLYDDQYVREMSQFMLSSLGFKQACCLQESICATFGAGISTACVIDIGARTTSISCVDEGLVVPESRMVLNFGGDDITQFMFSLLMRNGFPYRDADITKWYDWTVLENLKERTIVMSEADVGLNLYDFCVRKPGKATEKYKIRIYDDVILAPYALFAPRVIDFDSKVRSDPDLWSKHVDDNISIGGSGLTTAMKASTRHLLPPAPTANPALQLGATHADKSIAASPSGTPAPDDRSNTMSRQVSTGVDQDGTLAAPAVRVNVRVESSKLPLDVGAVESILAAGTEDKMKRLCQNMIITGGTGRIHNIGFAVESRVSSQLAYRVPSLAGQTAVVPSPRDIEPDILAWKGISVLSKLDAANELWVRKEEWDALGMRAVRERQFFWA